MEMNNLQTTTESTVSAIVITSKIAPRMSRERKPKDASIEEFEGRTPRVAKLMALAIHLQDLVDSGAVRDYAEIARVAGLTRARVTQIMNLNLLSPSIQEDILFMPRIRKGHDPITERHLRDLSSKTEWNKQISSWAKLKIDCMKKSKAAYHLD